MGEWKNIGIKMICIKVLYKLQANQYVNQQRWADTASTHIRS